jgi:predicted transcriptional regulator
MYQQPKNSELDRVRSWQHEIKDMLPKSNFTIDDLNEICHRFGFYSYHLVNNLIELNLIKRLDTNLFERR